MSMVKLCFAMLPSKQGFSSLNESIIKNYFPQCIKCIKYCNLCTCRYTHLRWCRSANRVPTPMPSMGRGVCSSCEHWDPLVCVCVEMMTMFYHMICLSVLWRQLDRKKTNNAIGQAGQNSELNAGRFFLFSFFALILVYFVSLHLLACILMLVRFVMEMRGSACLLWGCQRSKLTRETHKREKAFLQHLCEEWASLGVSENGPHSRSLLK